MWHVGNIMSVVTVFCPKCKTSVDVDVDEVIKSRVEESVKAQYRSQMVAWKEEEKKRLEKSVKEDLEKKLGDQSEELQNLKEELSKSRELELTLRREKNKLDDEKKAFELEKQRQLDVEREKIKSEAVKVLLDEHRLKDAEKDKKLADMAKMVEDLKLKAQQGSQQLQGEVFELELEELLKTEFPHDSISPVPKGVRGADVIQRIHDQTGRECGTIIWESKRTKHWTEDWVNKLKEDMRQTSADIAILVSIVLPQGVNGFAFRDGIYVTSFENLINVSKILRKGMIDITHTKLQSVGKNEKIEALYGYITSTEFAQKIDAMMEAFNAQKNDLEKEKAVMMKIWAKREKEIERLKSNTLTIHGSLSGLVEEQLPEPQTLRIETLSIEYEEEEDEA
jgi:hypothetical protein